MEILTTLASVTALVLFFSSAAFGVGRTFGTFAFVVAVLWAINVWGLSDVLLAFACFIALMLAFCVEPLIDHIRQSFARKPEEVSLEPLDDEWTEVARLAGNEIAFDMWKAEGNAKKGGRP